MIKSYRELRRLRTFEERYEYLKLGGAGDTIKMELSDILKGEYENPHVSIWWYKLHPQQWLPTFDTVFIGDGI